MGRPPFLVVCAGNHLTSVNRDFEAHFAAGFLRHAEVLFVDPPTSPVGFRRRPELRRAWRAPRVRAHSSGLLHLTPVVAPKPWTPPISSLTPRLVAAQLRDAAREVGRTPDAVITAWPFCDISSAFPRARLAYWWTDDPDSAASLWGMNRRRLVAGDRRLARRADVVMAVSANAAERMREHGIDARFLPNGCDLATISRTPLTGDTFGLAAPVAVYLGLLNDRTDLSLLEAVADGGQSLLIVGPRDERFEPARVAALCARPNVVAVGPVPFADIPDVLAGTAVGLVPYADTPFNRASFPLKALEYLAAGRPVVSTSLPAVRWLESEHITLADDPGVFAAAATRAARDPITAAAAAARRQFAAGHSWERRAATVAGWLGLSPRDAPPGADGRTAPRPRSPVPPS